MSYASIMVAADDGRHAPARVRLAAELAHRLGAGLVGAAACMPDYPRGYGETAVPMGMVIEEIRQAVLDRLAGVEQAFRHASALNDRVEWRADLGSPASFLEGQSRAADLVVVGRYADDEGVTIGMSVDAGDVLMRLGKPILVVPSGVEHLEARRVLVGWKNTPQTRRAVSDALPMIRRAEAVQVFRVSDGDDQAEVEDVARYLARHDVNATAHLAKPSGWTVADDVRKATRDFDADLIVAGAYGYSRMREWFFGGVTRDLLAQASVCCLLSH
ncbi:universal stress protein UspA [Methylobacterium radiotolerans]|nr:universal stress protein UspA [Methylobacterium radiotolerans]KTS49873.1 universal stress protein UspA [Methylobacterium radiotolerans]